METDFSLSPPIFWLWLFQEEEEEREALVLFQPCGKSSSSSFFLSISQNLLLLLLFFFIWDSFLSDLGIQFSSRRDRRNATRGMVPSGRGGKAQVPNELPNSFVNSNSCCFFISSLSFHPGKTMAGAETKGPSATSAAPILNPSSLVIALAFRVVLFYI